MPSTRTSINKVLIIDDEVSIRLLVKEILEDKNSIQVLEAANGEEALTIVENHDLKLIITDMAMPKLSGYDLLIEIKKRNIDVPVIVITGEQIVEMAVECIKLGAVDYITKPFDIVNFENLICNILTKENSSNKIQYDDGIPKNQNRTLGDYRIIQVIGEGNMGIVFLAEKMIRGIPHQFALKILKLSQGNEKLKELCKERFIHEAKAAASIRHKNIVKIIEYGISTEENIPYIVMEYIKGRSLKHFLSDNTLTYKEKILIIRQISEALAAIHECQICHRDIKPDNIIIDCNLNVIVTDFGIARLPDSDLTMTNDIMGSPAYISPEAFVSAKVDYRSDIFSLGSVSYELLVGERAFRANNLFGFCQCIRKKEPMDPRNVKKDFPEFLTYILKKMMKKRPCDRYSSAIAIINDLDQYLTAC